MGTTFSRNSCRVLGMTFVNAHKINKIKWLSEGWKVVIVVGHEVEGAKD
jgi:hypothetical protein